MNREERRRLAQMQRVLSMRAGWSRTTAKAWAFVHSTEEEKRWKEKMESLPRKPNRSERRRLACRVFA